MRVIELSNHPGDMLHDVSLRRQATQRRARVQYEDAQIQHQARVQTIRVQRDRARQNRRWWTWLRLIVAVWTEQRRAPRQQLPSAGDTDTEEKIRAGIAGEQLVATERGEIDHLLLGPQGLFAIEVKNINATVSIDGDRWRADKYDNYGNLVEQREVADRKGRSPSEQLNESAGELERFLHERGQRVTVQRVVVLTHRRSRVGPRRHPTVHVGTSTSYVLSLVDDSKQELNERHRADAERLIRRDHDYYERRRR
jgi:hypothetical protein